MIDLETLAKHSRRHRRAYLVGQLYVSALAATLMGIFTLVLHNRPGDYWPGREAWGTFYIILGFAFAWTGRRMRTIALTMRGLIASVAFPLVFLGTRATLAAFSGWPNSLVGVTLLFWAGFLAAWSAMGSVVYGPSDLEAYNGLLKRVEILSAKLSAKDAEGGEEE